MSDLDQLQLQQLADHLLDLDSGSGEGLLLKRIAARIEALETAGKRLADMLEAVTKQLRSWGHDPVVNVDAALAAWRVAEGGEDE